MIESRMDDGIGSFRTRGKPCRIFQRGDMGGSACGLQRSCAGLRAGETGHLMATRQQFAKNPGADEPGGTCQKNTHINLPR
ncbi:hypothetical protein D3C78_966930 [compost metagenome]